MKSLLNLLGRVVHVVNSDPPMESREAFYAAKDRVCRLFGRRETPDDIQHVVKDCWHCTRWDCEDCEDLDACCRCRGTDIYFQFWTRLARYRIGDYGFHRPIERLQQAPAGEPVTITGLIQHRRDYELELRRELALWLIVFFNPWWLIKRLLGLSYRPGASLKYPLTWFLYRIGWVENRAWRARRWWRDRQAERLKTRMKHAGLKVVEEEDLPF